MSLSPDPDHRELAGLVRPPAAAPSAPDAARALARELTVLPWRLAEHAERWPSHGRGCPCVMDRIARVRAAARELEASGPHGRAALERLRFVLETALGNGPREEGR